MKFTPATATRTSTWPDPGDGRATSLICRTPAGPDEGTRTARTDQLLSEDVGQRAGYAVRSSRPPPRAPAPDAGPAGAAAPAPPRPGRPRRRRRRGPAAPRPAAPSPFRSPTAARDTW